MREKADLIGRLEKLLAERDAAGADLANAIKRSDAAFRRMIELQGIMPAGQPAPPPRWL